MYGGYMEKITPQAVAELLETPNQGLAVTIYVPMHRAASPPHMSEDQLRLKNLVNQALGLLKDLGDTTALTRELQDYLASLLDNQKFWESQTEGLLVCSQAGAIRSFQLPIDTDEYVAVDQAFHLTPVLGLLHDATEFYVLAVAQHQPRLFIGDMYGLRPSTIDLPVSLEASLGLDENPKGEHSQSAGGSSLHTSVYNGRGGTHDLKDADRARFLRAVDAALTKEDTAALPLILAGTDEETSEFRHLSKYPNILANTIKGNAGNTSTEELFEQAHRIALQELIMPKRREAIAAYERLSGTNPARTAQDQPAIEAAAEQGRVDTLLIGMQRQTADTVRDSTQPVAKITFPVGTLKNAIHALAITVRGMSGTVVIVDEADMPNHAPMAALLRY
jgi:hypothetical protein